MLRIGSMNMTLHGVDNPNIRYKDSLSEEHAADTNVYSLVLANPPFAGSCEGQGTFIVSRKYRGPPFIVLKMMLPYRCSKLFRYTSISANGYIS